MFFNIFFKNKIKTFINLIHFKFFKIFICLLFYIIEILKSYINAIVFHKYMKKQFNIEVYFKSFNTFLEPEFYIIFYK